MSYAADGYVEVADRIQMFRDLYPTGSLQPADIEHPFEIVKIDPAVAMQWLQGEEAKIRAKGGRYVDESLAKLRQPLAFVVYVAAAYRTPDDPRPGIGIAWEPFPGETNYTHNSEIMNAETSAWGRAIIAVGAADAKASANEVRNRRAEQDDDSMPVAVAKLELVKALQGDKTLAADVWTNILHLPAAPERVTQQQLADAIRVGESMTAGSEPFAADTVEPLDEG